MCVRQSEGLTASEEAAHLKISPGTPVRWFLSEIGTPIKDGVRATVDRILESRVKHGRLDNDEGEAIFMEKYLTASLGGRKEPWV
jgi:hypothetical protein